eukprot:6470499-Amphidinium_carterae.1
MTPVQRGLLSQMGWSEVCADENAALPPSVSKQSYNQRCFEALGMESRWDGQEVETVYFEKHPWHSTSAQGLQLQVPAWQLLVTAASEQDEGALTVLGESVMP